MEETYKTPLARAARFLEIFIPAYMFGKSWGIADEMTVDLFRAEFPPFLIDMAEFMKGLVVTENENLGRLLSTTAGATVGFGVVLVLAAVFHFILRDRKYIDSVRYTSVTLIPIAVLNGTLSHAVKTLVENLGTTDPSALQKSAVQSPWSYFVLNVIFYLVAIWMMGKRTGVKRSRRFWLLSAGVGFVGLYLALGLMIMPEEWQNLLPTLQQSLGQGMEARP